ncbi:MAG: hypothetical protein ABIH92_05920, partial [Nanoarchaeota archaeon]
ERNVLASLNWETFRKFQEISRGFLKNPSGRFFQKHEINASGLEKRARKKKAEFLHIVLETSRQGGDIAGTKMKKFSGFLERELGKYFGVLEKEFFYPGEGQNADFYLVLKSKKEFLKVGPPLSLEKDVKKFRKANKKTFVKNKVLHARVKVDFSARDFIKKWVKSKEGKLKLDGMGISGLKIN